MDQEKEATKQSDAVRKDTPVNAASASRTSNDVGPSSVPLGRSFPLNVNDLPDDPFMPDLEDTAEVQNTLKALDVEAGLSNDQEELLLFKIEEGLKQSDDIIFGSTKKSLCIDFEQIMHKRFQMSSMGELTFFLGLQVKQKEDGIFISQDKYVGEILKKFGFSNVRTASTPMLINKVLTKDEDGEDVDVHLYRLISWQCKKQTVVANSTTKAEYIVASHFCGQVLWIQNQMLDYGYNFMQTKIYVDNESAICVVKNHVYHSKIKHIEIWHHFIRDSYEKRLIEMVKIHTDNNVVDLLTKAFDVSRFNFLVASIFVMGGLMLDMVWRCSLEEFESQDLVLGMDTGGSPKHQDTMRGTLAQTRSERVLEKPNKPPLLEGHTSRSRKGRMEHQFELTANVPLTPHDSPLPGGYTPGSDEGRLQLQELMTMCTKLSKQVLDLEKEKDAQAVEILRLMK
ncbi:putative ribonuclease H-like domain-containing protein [Tanacetum coccineum]|uniref:Ribonuclease H-like domain-containing protein n=1 Tax=Tanacetum coccineum TaxID=301880 RepID=A0ABQ5GDD0_9ASTR